MLTCSIIRLLKTYLQATIVMQPRDQYATILGICKAYSSASLTSKGNLPHVGRVPLCSDCEIMALTLLQESLRINSESRFCSWLRENLPQMARKLGTRRNYNARKKRIVGLLEPMRQGMVKQLLYNCGDDLNIVDSMPIQVCRNSRAKSSKILKDNALASPSFGRCETQQERYYGYKFHCVCTDKGVIRCYDLTAAYVHDIHYLNDVKYEIGNCFLIGDKGYRSKPRRMELFEWARIELSTPCRANEHEQHQMPEDYMKIRKRIEVVFAQLVDQLSIRQNYAKTQIGFFVRIISKITLFTMAQYFNLINNRNINHTCYAFAA